MKPYPDGYLDRFEYGDTFACDNDPFDDFEVKCMNDLRYLINVGDGLLGERDPQYPDPWEPVRSAIVTSLVFARSALLLCSTQLVRVHARVQVAGKRRRVYGVGPMPGGECPSRFHAKRAYHFPCVSSPISHIAYRSACSLQVYAGRVRNPNCDSDSGSAGGRGTDGASAVDDDLAHVGCEMHPGSHIVFEGLSDSSAVASFLGREWMVGGRADDSPTHSFWIYREDAAEHGMVEGGHVTITPDLIDTAGGAAAVFARCVLETVPPIGETCCNETFSYPACLHHEPGPWQVRIYLISGAAFACGSLFLFVVGMIVRARHLRTWRRSERLLSQQQQQQQQEAPGEIGAVHPASATRELLPEASPWRTLDAPPCSMRWETELPAWDVIYVDVELSGSSPAPAAADGVEGVSDIPSEPASSVALSPAAAGHVQASGS